VRLLHVIAAMRPGGAERIVVQLAADSVARGDDVVVASSGGAWVPRLEAAGADHVSIPLPGRSNLNVLRAAGPLLLLLRRFRPHVVHSHNVGVTVAVRLAMLASGVRPALLTTVHGLAPEDYRHGARLLRLAGCRVVACAPSVARSLAAGGFPLDGIEVITNGAALTPAGPDRLDAVRAAFGVGDRPLVVGIGRLVPQKAWWTLIAAARELPGVDVVVAGDGPLRADLEGASQALGGAVRFLGAVEDPAALLGLARCLVSTSTWEGLPLAVLEALSLGVPTVATAVDGVCDVVPADAAVLVPPNDPPAVAAAVRRVLGDSGVAEQLSRRGRLASGGWSPETMLAGYRRTYAVIAARRRG
jgi:glycosyltransferase involved in cell wall biosynthesis